MTRHTFGRDAADRAQRATHDISGPGSDSTPSRPPRRKTTTSSEPHGISRRSVLRGAAIVGAAAMPQLLTSTPAHAADDNTGGSCTVAFDDNAAKRQTILGLGFEIQSDSIGSDSNTQITENYTGSGVDFRPVFNNEFEYLGGHGPVVDRDTLNTAQSIMNWMTFQNAPTWWWLHALKPSTDALSENYGLGTWRPPGAPADSRFPGLQPGDWTFNPRNWNAVAGFVRFMPWDSVRYNVEEPHPTEANGGLKTHPNGVTTPGNVTYRPDQRIMAWKTPGGKPVLVVTNRGNANYTFTVDTRTTGTFRGYRYGPSTNMAGVGAKSGTTLTLTVPPLSIEFWVHD
nr:hypothetical protein KPHV_07420 [Kitasatospora purpeofusca]